MPLPATKRRKLSHSPSESGDDDNERAAPSASVTDESGEEMEDEVEDEDDIDALNNGGSEDDMVVEEEGDEDDDIEEEEDDDEDEVEADTSISEKQLASTNKAAKAATKQQPRPSNNNKANAAEASAAAYTGGTFKSNMFKLEVDEMLGQIRPRHGQREKTAEEALHKIKRAIEQLPERAAMSVLDAERELIKKSKVAIPFPEPRPAHGAQYKLAYAKPAHVNVVGSYPLKINVRNSVQPMAIDMLVTMPKALFQEKDYLNHRYFHKRAFYLACIAAGLKKSLDHFTITFANFHDNPLHPILVVHAKEQKAENAWQINIIPAIPDKTFAGQKLLPNKNCVRPAKADDDAEDKALPSTPFYNASIGADTQVTAYLRLLHSASTSCDAFKDACLLGRVWLRQRGFTSNVSKGGFGNFEWAAVIAVLLQTGGGSGMPLLSSRYSSYQLFKATLQYLASKDLTKQPAVFHADGLKLTAENGQPIFFDGQRSQNILYKMTSSSYALLRSVARTTLQMLSDNLFDQFESTFILRADNILQRHDLSVKIPLSAFKSETSEDRDTLERHQKLYAVLQRGLGDRAANITLSSPEQQMWATGSARPSRKGDILINMTLDFANVHRTVDHGPSAENKKEAANFRDFWGEKAELRRFKDGSILEALVWSTKEGGMPIVQQIVTWLLYRHFGENAAASAKFYLDDFAKMIKHASSTGSASSSTFQPLAEAFKQFETDIRAFEELPLTIRSIMPADAQLRHASVEPPLTPVGKPMSQPADVVLQFEGSARWPDDLAAIQRTKIAFLLQIGKSYTDAVDGVTARVGLENPESEVQNQGFLDVIYPSGAAFRLRIHHDREATLLQRVLSDKTAAPSSKENAATALAAYKRDYLKTPAHTAAVSKLCTRFPALSSSIRVTKRWFSEHLLSNHFPSELIELFVLRTFTQPWPYGPPSSARTGFLRTLSWLSRWDWRADPLIVDLGAADEKMSPAALAAIRTRFDAWRKLDPSLNRICLFAASSVDTDGTTYTDGAPAKVVAGRLTALAKAAVALADAQGLELDADALFASSLADYDFVIHLCSSSSKKSKKSAAANPASEFKNLSLPLSAEHNINPELVGFDAASLFREDLTRIYGQALLLFSGDANANANAIAGLWTPYTADRSWKVNLAYSTVPVPVPVLESGEKEDAEENGGAQRVVARVNKEGILKEIARLGGDLVKRIDVNRL